MTVPALSHEPERLRVLLDARTLDDHFPGIGRYTFHLAQALLARPDVDLTLLINPHAHDRRFRPLDAHFPPSRLLHVPYTPFSPLAQGHLPLLLAAHRHAFDLYHSPYYLYPYLIPLPTVVTLHDVIPTRFPQYFSPLTRRVVRLLKTLAVRRAAHILVDSQATARDVHAYYHVPTRRITVAPLAPAPQFRPLPPAQVAATRARYRLPDRYFLYVGSDKPHKNLSTLLAAWDRLSLPSAGDPPFLVLAGLMRHPPTEDVHIRYIGPVPETDLPALYGGAWAFLFPSVYEGFGLPVVEAMACGTPVICSDIPALVELTPRGAWHLPPRDIDTWVDAVQRMWQDEGARHQLAVEALAQARTYTWERTAHRTWEAYRQALAPKGPLLAE